MNKKQIQNTFTIYEIIAYHYYDFKAIAERETRKFQATNASLDEDIFHNVLLSMSETIGNNDCLITVKQAKGYFCNSFKNALCRETLYARNRYRINKGFEECLFKTKSGELDTRIDFNSVMVDVENNYGKKEVNLFQEFMSGFKLHELNEKYNINNADYIVRKIKNYIKKEYPEFKLKRRNKS